MNSLTQEPIGGAGVRVYFVGNIPGPGHSPLKTIKVIDTITNEEGWFVTVPWIGPPKGLFVTRHSHWNASKAGFVYSRGRYQFRTDAIYLVPEAEWVMEAMRDWWWAAENRILLDSTSANPDKVSEFNDTVWRYVQYVGAYNEAKKIAKTEPERQFLAELCDRVLKFYEGITWTQNLEEERVKLFGCGDRCSYENVKKCKSTPEWFLSSRHGECAPLSVLSRRNPEWGQVRDPHQFIETMRIAGHRTDVREYSIGEGTAVQVDVPAVELSLMFVGRSACREFIDHER